MFISVVNKRLNHDLAVYLGLWRYIAREEYAILLAMVTIFLEYFYWHYTIAPFEILQIMQNYLKANWHRFLIVQHFRTLFAPWHRQNPSDFGTKQKTFGDKILDVMVDVYIRLIAAGIRLIIITGGFLVEFLTLIAFLLLFVVWLAWPVISIYLIVRGLDFVTVTKIQ